MIRISVPKIRIYLFEQKTLIRIEHWTVYRNKGFLGHCDFENLIIFPIRPQFRLQNPNLTISNGKNWPRSENRIKCWNKWISKSLNLNIALEVRLSPDFNLAFEISSMRWGLVDSIWKSNKLSKWEFQVNEFVYRIIFSTNLVERSNCSFGKRKFFTQK